MSRSDDERVADIPYHRIDLDQVWQIATGSVPDLVRHLRNDDAVDF